MQLLIGRYSVVKERTKKTKREDKERGQRERTKREDKERGQRERTKRGQQPGEFFLASLMSKRIRPTPNADMDTN
jgi:hypothetical protein